MTKQITVILILLLPTTSWCGQVNLQSELEAVNALTSDADLKLAVVARMADDLSAHRNHLLLLRRETGKTFAEIYIAELRSRGDDDQAILTKLKALRRSVQPSAAAGSDRPSWRPVVQTIVSGDHSSAGDLVTILPEVGVDSKRYAVILGIPMYQTSTVSQTATGLGDVYLSSFLRRKLPNLDLGAALTVAAPTGDRTKGLGTGRVTIDATGTLSRRVEWAKLWASSGMSNGASANSGYARPYAIAGTSMHIAGGIDVTLARRCAAELSGFSLLPFGDQTVYSQSVTPPSSTTMPTGTGSGGMMPGGGMGGHGGSTGGSMTPPTGASSGMPFYATAQRSVVSASEARDFGGTAAVTITFHAGLTFTTGVSYSGAFHFTVIRSAVGVDVTRFFGTLRSR